MRDFYCVRTVRTAVDASHRSWDLRDRHNRTPDAEHDSRHRLRASAHVIGKRFCCRCAIGPQHANPCDQTQKICSIKIDYDIDNAGAGNATTRVFWRNSSAGEDYDGMARNGTVTLPTGEQSATFWVYGTIDQFRFDPDVKPCTFHLRKISFLVED